MKMNAPWASRSNADGTLILHRIVLALCDKNETFSMFEIGCKSYEDYMAIRVCESLKDIVLYT